MRTGTEVTFTDSTDKECLGIVERTYHLDSRHFAVVTMTKRGGRKLTAKEPVQINRRLHVFTPAN